MQLTPEQVDQFDRDGYLILPRFFDAREVAVMQAELQRLIDDGKLRNVATEGDGETQSNKVFNLQVCPLSPHSDLFRSLPFCSNLRETVRQLIGEAFVLQLDQIFLKPAKVGAGTNWHQDNAYFGIPDPKQGTGMWVALHDATVANGTMHIVPGSYKREYEHARDPESDHHITCKVDEQIDEVLPVEMEAGGVLFFNYGTAHCTHANTTDTDRAGLALHFLKAEHQDLIGGAGPSHPVLSGPHYSGGREELGVNMEGQWERKVADTPSRDA